MSKLFYRIGVDNQQGLWYNKSGEFTGLIRKQYNWLTASVLIMPFEQELVGYLSVADSLEHLYQWFSREEILKLQEDNFLVYEYLASDFKFYNLYNHNVINESTSVLHNKIKLI